MIAFFFPWDLGSAVNLGLGRTSQTREYNYGGGHVAPQKTSRGAGFIVCFNSGTQSLHAQRHNFFIDPRDCRNSTLRILICDVIPGSQFSAAQTETNTAMQNYSQHAFMFHVIFGYYLMTPYAILS